MLFMRQYDGDAWQTIRRNRWLFIGLAGYPIVLLVIMFNRGFGLRILGTSQMGGRFYFQQLTCVVFPVLFAMWRGKETTLTKLFILQCILSTTYLISDFVLSYTTGSLFYLLQFFELPGDATNFERLAQRTGLRRFQSLYVVGTGLLYLLVVKFSLKDFVGRRAIFLLPVSAALFMIGLFSGHRYLFLILGMALAICAFSQRFYTVQRNMAAGAIVVLFLVFIYIFAEHLPLPVQRAASFLPGLQVDRYTGDDARATLEVRKELRRRGWEMVPDYLWLGRGFGQSSSSTDSALHWDPTPITSHVEQGKFYNGFIGLMVNTGIPGTATMLMFLFGGTLLSFRIIGHLRRYGADDDFSRMCSLASGLWIANVTAFLIFHGDSEIALKTFAVQSGLLLVAHRLLLRRVGVLAEDQATQTQTAPTDESPALAWRPRG